MSDKRVPVVGITCSRIEAGQKHSPPHWGQRQTYIDALIQAGAVPLLIPALTDLTRLRILYDLLDGLLLAGGDDIDPWHYGELLHEKCGQISPERDATELALTGWAVEGGKPLLAICRGIQVLNVALGGSLYQDIGAQIPEAGKHTSYPDSPRDRLSHSIFVTPGTRLAHVLGETSLGVNSMHHQAVKALAPGLTVAAVAPDGVIEAIEAEGHHFAVGVQWHPEHLAVDDPRQQRLFDALAQACEH